MTLSSAAAAACKRRDRRGKTEDEDDVDDCRHPLIAQATASSNTGRSAVANAAQVGVEIVAQSCSYPTPASTSINVEVTEPVTMYCVALSIPATPFVSVSGDPGDLEI